MSSNRVAGKREEKNFPPVVHSGGRSPSELKVADRLRRGRKLASWQSSWKPARVVPVNYVFEEPPAETRGEVPS